MEGDERDASVRSSLSPARDLSGVWGLPQLPYNYFNFVVAEPKKYIPNSGPPLLPITDALEHDKTGFIIDKVFLRTEGHKELRYIVGFRDHPHLRVCVRLQNILDWVSAWEAETWELKDCTRQAKEEEDLLLPGILAREALKKKKLSKLLVVRDRVVKNDGRTIEGKKRKRVGSLSTDTSKKKGTVAVRSPGRPLFANLGIVSTKSKPSAPGRRRQLSDEPPRLFTSPSAKRRIGTGLAEIAARDLDSSDSDDDSADADAAIQTQLRDSSRADVEYDSSDALASGSSHSLMKQSQFAGKPTHNYFIQKHKSTSVSTSPGLTPSLPASNYGAVETRQGLDRREKRFGQNISDTANVGSHKAWPQSRLSQSARETSSSHDHDPDADRQEEEDVVRDIQLSMDSSKKSVCFMKSSTRKDHSKIYRSPFDPPSPAKISSRRHQPDFQSDNDGEEYTINRILQSRIEVTTGKPKKHYLIKWEGNWPDTWEPEENVGSVAAKGHREALAAQQSRVAKRKLEAEATMVAKQHSPNKIP
ncbi:hypothetical protein BJ878DRAFT_481391 [Calycina marina]|uniref:Chromo domain-containing protein n=1 Tax=Calycina marina TaxID=1763456 RepID=A0A9P8CDK0_9HELO|nr:hypothetical protein BJ878DRAFT_481391 [Calycina marina]